MSSCDEYLFINQANAQDLPEGDNNIDNWPLNVSFFYLTSGDVYSQEVLNSHTDVSVVPMLSSKHKVSELVEYYILAEYRKIL